MEDPSAHDTWLARVLHQEGRLPLDVLQEALAAARAGRARGATLAGVLEAGGHISGEGDRGLARLR